MLSVKLSASHVCLCSERDGVRPWLDGGPQAAPPVRTSARSELLQYKRDVTV